MAEKSKIQWTEFTWNPWHGCRKVSPGCKFCYMYRDKDRYGHDPSAVLRSKTAFNKPLSIKEPSLIFTCSWSDWFIEEADEWRNDAWEIIKNTPQHTYQILTKRPDRILQCLPKDWGDGYPNVWLGISAENQQMFMERLPYLVSVNSIVRFVSAEPLLGPIDFRPFLNFTVDARTGKPGSLIDWVIVGGESGNETGKWRYRPCESAWICQIISQCNSYGVPVFNKQLGTHLSKKYGLKDRHGGDINEWPLDLQVRAMPVLFNQ